MSFLPWQSFPLRSRLGPAQVLDGLTWSIPACCRWPNLIDDPQFFCGTVNAEAGTFRFQRNVSGKARGWFPELRGKVRSAQRGSVIDVSISPSPGFWLGMMPVFFLAAFIPLGLLLWLFDMPMQQGSPLAFVWIPLLGLVFLSWLWGPLLAITYSSLPRYRREIGDLLESLSERFDGELPILDLADTPEQVETKRQRRIHAGQNAMRIIGAFLALMGTGLFCVGVEGLRTGKLTMYGRRHHHRVGDPPPKTTLVGEQAATMSKALMSLGSGLTVAGGVWWLVARHDPARFARRRNSPSGSWPPLETGLLAISVVLLMLGIVLSFQAFY